jgi:hypothetical protein
MCLFTRSLLLTGQLSCFDTLLISLSLSLCSLVQSYIRWCTVRFPPSQGHSGDSYFKTAQVCLSFAVSCYVCIYVYVCMYYVCTYVLYVFCICVYVCIMYVGICMYMWVSVCMYVLCLYGWICMYVCMHVCMYVYIHLHIFLFPKSAHTEDSQRTKPAVYRHDINIYARLQQKAFQLITCSWFSVTCEWTGSVSERSDSTRDNCCQRQWSNVLCCAYHPAKGMITDCVVTQTGLHQRQWSNVLCSAYHPAKGMITDCVATQTSGCASRVVVGVCFALT